MSIRTFLQSHPFAVDAHFERSLVLTFCAPKAALAHLIPECLSLDAHNDEIAFVAVAMVQTKSLRPAGFPRVFGADFFLIGYRVFVRYKNAAGRRLRGLYILKSETNSRRMRRLGNIFTHYRYGLTDIAQHEDGEVYSVSSADSGFNVSVCKDADAVLPAGSPFRDWKEARRFAGPLPFTFSVRAGKREVVIVEGVREHWTPRPVTVLRCDVPWIATLSPELRLCSAFMVEDIPYHWKKGRTEIWTPEG